MLRDKRILVVEAEFLIAIDIQRLLESARALSTVFARSAAEALSLEPGFGEFDLAIIEYATDKPASLALISRLRDSGVSIVATTTEPTNARWLPGPPPVPLVKKPIESDLLLSACIAALAIDRRDI